WGGREVGGGVSGGWVFGSARRQSGPGFRGAAVVLLLCRRPSNLFPPRAWRDTIRLLAVADLAIETLASTLLIAHSEAKAVVCARGPWRAGCSGPRGASIVRHTAFRWVWVGGMRVHRCA